MGKGWKSAALPASRTSRRTYQSTKPTCSKNAGKRGSESSPAFPSMRTKGVIQVEFQKVFNLILAAGFFLTGLAQAQEDSSASATVQLTLQKAEELALSGNPHIRAAEERTRAADKQVLPTLFPDDPTVMVDTTFPGMEMWQVEEKLGFPGKGIAKADMAGAEAKKTDAEAQDTRRSIVLQARQA